MFERFVAVDVETTGDDPRHDRIIEIGAVRFENGEAVDRFSTLLNPGCRLPTFITRLTGLTDEMVAEAPFIENIWQEFTAFCGGDPLVAHNAAFDRSFLQAEGARLMIRFPANRWLDTLELSRLVWPWAKSHRLAALYCEISPEPRTWHRALDDAEAAGVVFIHLCRKLVALPDCILQEMVSLLAPLSPASLPLLQEALREKHSTEPQNAFAVVEQAVPRYSFGEGEGAAPERKPVSAGQIRELFTPDGALAKSFSGFELRPGQLDMIEQVCRALNEDKHLLIEAGTGTGKSLAYLLPVIFFAKANRGKVVIATHTINLQEQLWEKDIPHLSAALREDVRAALLKGRNNYICLRKWRQVLNDVNLLTDPADREFLAELWPWLLVTKTGDRAELNLHGSLEEAWDLVAAEQEGCFLRECPFFNGRCFAWGARAAAAKADVVIVNHSLLFMDMKLENSLLPPYEQVIIDEAHHLEDEATRFLGQDVSYFDLIRWFNKIHRGASRGDGLGLWALTRRRLYRAFLPAAKSERYEQLLTSLLAALQEAKAETDRFFAVLAEILSGNENLRLTEEILASPDLAPTLARKENLLGKFDELARLIKSLILTLEEESNTLSSTRKEWEVALSQLLSFASAIDFVMDGEHPDYVCWLEGKTYSDRLRVTLKSAPVSVGPVLREMLFQTKKSVVLTSATLSVNGKFNHLKERIGLADFPSERLLEHHVPSFFDYQKQALLCFPSDLPVPKDVGDEYVMEIAGFLTRLIKQTKGRALLLFTSHQMLREVYTRMKDELTEEGYLLLGHGIDGSRSRLVEEFKGAERAVLFGASSFWEGVDIPGPDLSCVVIVKLPFMPPNMPIVQARMEALEREGKSSFYQYSLPAAVIRFKQGFGRLIRRRGDKGAVVVLDPRVVLPEFRYGRQFLYSLPNPRVTVGSQKEIIEIVGEWLTKNL